jgi:DNA-binding NtrC family response regulator
VHAKNSISKVVSSGRTSTRSGKVLIAAHDLRVAGLIQEYLLETGYDAVCELNLDAAIEKSIGTRIDLLIVDGEMPEKVLTDFVEAVHRMKPEMPMIVVGMSEHETQSRALSAFVSAFIETPFSISDISNIIKETIKSHSSIDSLRDAASK